MYSASLLNIYTELSTQIQPFTYKNVKIKKKCIFIFWATLNEEFENNIAK